jgi:hypothetical protein
MAAIKDTIEARGDRLALPLTTYLCLARRS